MRKTFLCLIPIVVYILLRACVYRFVDMNEYGWFFRDFVMNAPRILSAILMICFIRSIWGLEILKFHTMRFGYFLKTAVVALVTYTVWVFLHSQHLSFTNSQLMMFVTGSLIVAIFEEISFRGGIYQALSDWLGASWAIVVSTLLFVVFHVQAQPIHELPQLIGFGLIVALLRSKGVSIWWTILLHFLVLSIPVVIPLAGTLKFPQAPLLMSALWFITVSITTRLSISKKTPPQHLIRIPVPAKPRRK